MIRDRLLDAWAKSERADGTLTPTGQASLAAALEAEACKLRDAADRPGATILISVDQAEELARADGDSGEALAAYLHVALAAPRAAGNSPSPSAPTSSPNCKAIAASRT